MEPDDDYCTDGPQCRKTGPRGYVCTRTRGHDGIHVAHAGREHVCERWPQKVDQQAVEAPTVIVIGSW